MLWDFNVKSQNVVDEHGDLLELVDQYMLEHNFSKLQCPKMAKLQGTMEKFQGFNTLNYFTLNKSCQGYSCRERNESRSRPIAS